jgi:hypothetical protein
MPHPLLTSILAQTDAWSRWSASLRGPSSFDVSRVGVLAAGLAVGVFIAWCYSRRFARPTDEVSPQNPQRLFVELCRAHKLSAAQRRLLEWLVAERQLIQPALVFLDPILLESAIAHADSPSVRRRLTELQSRLFAGIETGTNQAAKA